MRHDFLCLICNHAEQRRDRYKTVLDELWLDREPQQPLLPPPLFGDERTRRDGTGNDVNDPSSTFGLSDLRYLLVQERF
jgi:hypothetical protein